MSRQIQSHVSGIFRIFKFFRGQNFSSSPRCTWGLVSEPLLTAPSFLLLPPVPPHPCSSKHALPALYMAQIPSTRQSFHVCNALGFHHWQCKCHSHVRSLQALTSSMRYPCLFHHPSHSRGVSAVLDCITQKNLSLFLTVLRSMWDLSSWTRDWTYSPCIGSTES